MLIVAMPGVSRRATWIPRRSFGFIGSSATARPVSWARLAARSRSPAEEVLALSVVALDVDHDALVLLGDPLRRLVHHELERVRRAPLAPGEAIRRRTAELVDDEVRLLALTDLERPEREPLDRTQDELADRLQPADRGAHRLLGRAELALTGLARCLGRRDDALGTRPALGPLAAPVPAIAISPIAVAALAAAAAPPSSTVAPVSALEAVASLAAALARPLVAPAAAAARPRRARALAAVPPR